MSVNKDMGDSHEKYLHSLFGGRQTKGSGNQWQNPVDGRQSRYEKEWAFAWDGKSTYAGSLSLSRKMWAKIAEQAAPEIPMLAFRFYDTTWGQWKLQPETDLIVIEAETFAEILEAAELWNLSKKTARVLSDPESSPSNE